MKKMKLPQTVEEFDAWLREQGTSLEEVIKEFCAGRTGGCKTYYQENPKWCEERWREYYTEYMRDMPEKLLLHAFLWKHSERGQWFWVSISEKWERLISQWGEKQEENPFDPKTPHLQVITITQKAPGSVTFSSPSWGFNAEVTVPMYFKTPTEWTFLLGDTLLPSLGVGENIAWVVDGYAVYLRGASVSFEDFAEELRKIL